MGGCGPDAVAANGKARLGLARQTPRVAVAYLSGPSRFFFLFISLVRPQPGFTLSHFLTLSLSFLALSFSSKMEDVFDGAVGIDLGTTYS